MANTSQRFLALLRGINVGGKNIIPMEALRRCFEDLGCADVRTYIQSGNVLFRSERSGVKALTTLIEEGLSHEFSYEAHVVVLASSKYKAAVQAAPPRWGKDDERKHNALFTLTGMTPSRVLSQLPEPVAQIETATTGPGVIFWSASAKHQAKTAIMKIGKLPIYKQLTVRNHKTVFKLLELLEDR